MSTAEVALNASLARLNALKGQGDITHLPYVTHYRLELKTTMRLIRQVIDAEPDETIRALRRKQLRCLKSIHYDCVGLEAVAVQLSTMVN